MAVNDFLLDRGAAAHGGCINDGVSHSLCFLMPRQFNPVLRYVFSAVIASMFYLIWFGVFFYLATPAKTSDLQFTLGFAIFFYVFGGFMPALGLMIAPWVLVVRVYRRVNIPGSIYFSLMGAVSLVGLGCVTSSIAPKPLFVEDQTFLEGVVIAAERQGPCLLLAGILFGLTYWISSGRRR